MKCLILGGGGFLGSHLSEKLLEMKHEVTVFEIKGRSQENIQHISDDIKWIEGDFDDNNHIKNAVQNIDIIFHLIGTTTPHSSNENPIYDVVSNVLPTLNLLEIIKYSNVKKLIFFSSGGTVYGLPKKIPIDESHRLNPKCSYGINKITIEKYLDLYRFLYGIDFNILRISNPYGPRQIVYGNQGVISAFLSKSLNKKTIEVFGDGKIIRDYIFVSDVVSAAALAVEYIGAFKIFNIGSGVGLSLIEIIKVIETTLNRKIVFEYKESRKFDVPINLLDNSLAKKELKWEPLIGIEDGIKKTLNFLKTSKTSHTHK